MQFIGVTLFVFLAKLLFSLAEVFTAMADMEVLLDTEKQLTNNMRSFIAAEEARMKQIRRYLSEYEHINEQVRQDATKYLSNPLNAYVLVKRLTVDLKELENVVMNENFPNFLVAMKQLKNTFHLPSEEDLNGAAVALTRLQDTYNLDTAELADGILMGTKYSRNLTAGDCFELGRQLYVNADYEHAEPWFREALRKDLQEERKTIKRIKVLRYLKSTAFSLGHVEEALALIDRILKEQPNNERLKLSKANYEKILQDEELDETESEVNQTEHHEDESQLDEESAVDEHYKALCRGEKLLDTVIESRLKCRYVHKNVPFLLLGPVKEEEASLNPRIVVYHDVIFDSEIASIRKLAQPRFERATVVVVDTGESFTAPYRIAKSSFINDDEHYHVEKVSRRVGLITGLDMTIAESLQVVNYGIGGQYEPHNDHSSNDVPNAHSPEGQDWGNRIATWLFYMSDVEAGGATVFPRINVALWPRKGSAALWFNLLPNGDGDDRTYHASCPVLTGSKWVCNKWIHERTQLFRRPCKVDRNAQL